LQRLDSLEGDLEAADAVVANRVALTAEGEDDTGALLDHVARRGPRREEHGPGERTNRSIEVLKRHLGQGCALHVLGRDDVEGDVEGAVLTGHRVGEPVDRDLVKGVDQGRVGGTAGRSDVVGHRVEGGLSTTSQVDRRSFTGEGASDGAADGASASVDHCLLAVERHLFIGESAKPRRVGGTTSSSDFKPGRERRGVSRRTRPACRSGRTRHPGSRHGRSGTPLLRCRAARRPRRRRGSPFLPPIRRRRQ
jgi:hypothetical protein